MSAPSSASRAARRKPLHVVERLQHGVVACERAQDVDECKPDRPGVGRRLARLGEQQSDLERRSALPHERWGKIVAAFIKRRAAVDEKEFDQFCRTSGLANFKRPRQYVFVREIPKSPVGKLLRRKLIAGEFEPEGQQGTAA